MSNILLGVAGSVAAYRACDLARDLMRAGHSVRVCLTDSAQKFVSAALFEALTGNPCLSDTFEEPIPGRMAHIDWARQTNLLVISPATSNLLSKLAAGIGDDMLSTIILAYSGPILIAPAMNPSMYTHPATQDAIRLLKQRGTYFAEPLEGDVACGENGQGKLASIETISREAQAILGGQADWSGKHIVITTGPTQEPLDDVRFLTNRSSGKMGEALCRAALLTGATVTVVAGSTPIVWPAMANVVHVRTAQEMLAAVLSACPQADLLVGCAAVADFRPVTKLDGKMKRNGKNITVTLTPNPDILATVSASWPKLPIVGFAAEHGPDLEGSLSKIGRKGLSAIAHNDLSKEGIGFESDFNDLTLVQPDGSFVRSGYLSKLECAVWLFAQIKVLVQ